MADKREKVMFKGKLCVIVGAVNLKSLIHARHFAKSGCNIAFMDSNKALGVRFADVVKNKYGVKVFFFHGRTSSEEDLDIFKAATLEQFGHADFLINGTDARFLIATYPSSWYTEIV